MRDDIAVWLKETDQALDGLKKLEDALREHRKGLQGRLEVIAAEEKGLKGHEHSLAEFSAAARGMNFSGLLRPTRRTPPGTRSSGRPTSVSRSIITQ